MKNISETSSKSLKREEMVKYAFDTFYKNGFHATGVDTVMEGTGISKRTLYKHFGSKEGLILATIDYYRSFMGERISGFINSNPSAKPIDKVLRIFDFLQETIENGNTKGCFVMNAKTEYINKAQDIETSCDDYILGIQQLLEDTLKDTDLQNKDAAVQVMMLFEGAIVRSKVTKSIETAILAKKAARIILEF